MPDLVNKETLLAKINVLEVKADHYCRTDWQRYQEVRQEIDRLDMILLDIYNSENESFLQNHPKEIA